MHTCVSAHTRMQVCRPERRGKCFALSLSTYSFGTGSLPESGAGPEASTPQRSLCLHKDLGVGLLLCIGHLACYRNGETRTQVLKVGYLVLLAAKLYLQCPL